ncbi:MAG: 50S ribosomal protein L13 [Candidatus Sumerlaeaceae bacterium]|nr:50S ribosomal protein L13 [Candidatus Sumerlaeaceae bacterium]
MNSTYYPRAKDAQEKWYIVDAKGEVVGRLASRVAAILRGKTRPTFHPAVNSQAHVVVINADKAILTGRKLKQKKYESHSGYPGGFKSKTAEELHREKPGDILRRAINGMLPHTSLGSALKTNLRIYAGESHPHSAQQPEAITVTKPRAKKA